MPRRKTQAKSWLVRVRETVIREYVVEAPSAEDAGSDPHSGRGLPLEIDLVDRRVREGEPVIPDHLRPIVEGILYIGGALAFVVFLIRVAWTEGGKR